jgi:hypothetical protein
MGKQSFFEQITLNWKVTIKDSSDRDDRRTRFSGITVRDDAPKPFTQHH